MGLSSIKCDGLLYAENGEVVFGDGSRSASDLEESDLLKGAAFLALLAAGTFVVGCIEEEKRNLPVRLEDERTSDGGFDASLSSNTRGENIIYKNRLVFYGDESGAEYTVTFKGLDETGQVAHYGIRRIDMNTSAVEERDFALANYHSPGTPGEALVQYHELMKNGTTDKVALLDFDGNKNLPGLKLIAYAKITKEILERGSDVQLNVVEGYLEAPQGGR